MKAVRIHAQGGTDVLRYEDIPVPEPGAGQVRVRLEASGVNFIDIYRRSGQYRVELPFTLGDEGAGTVDALGAGVTDFHVGDRVAYGFTSGAYADYALVPADQLVPIPAHVDAQLAASSMLQGMTAHYLTHSTFPLASEHTALVHAAAGATGQLIVQIAKLKGARVIATVSTEAKAQIARDAGADDVILYSQQDFEAETRRLTDGRGVDVVYDSVGRDTFDRSLKSLRPRGYMVLFGQSSGAVNPVDPQTLNRLGSLFFTRPSLGAYIATRAELLMRAGAVLNWIAQGKLNIRIDRTFPLAEAAAAHDALESRSSKGKLLLIP